MRPPHRSGIHIAALEQFKKALALDPSDALILMELDQLYKRLNRSMQTCLQFLNTQIEVANQRDDVYLERIAALNFSGDYEVRKLYL